MNKQIRVNPREELDETGAPFEGTFGHIPAQRGEIGCLCCCDSSYNGFIDVGVLAVDIRVVAVQDAAPPLVARHQRQKSENG